MPFQTLHRFGEHEGKPTTMAQAMHRHPRISGADNG